MPAGLVLSSSAWMANRRRSFLHGRPRHASVVSVNKQIPTAPQILPRNPDGNGKITVSGELKQWHKVTLNLSGPYTRAGQSTESVH